MRISDIFDEQQFGELISYVVYAISLKVILSSFEALSIDTHDLSQKFALYKLLYLYDERITIGLRISDIFDEQQFGELRNYFLSQSALVLNGIGYINHWFAFKTTLSFMMRESLSDCGYLIFLMSNSLGI